MQLLDKELRLELPALYGQEDKPNKDKNVYAKFFFPAGNWTWFVFEGSQQDDDFIFYGYVIGHAEEHGYFSLNELEGIEIGGLSVERDLYFQTGRFEDVLTQFRGERS